ncbi:MAG TPA: ribosome maturation factor RimM [Candidatus Acidoferrales bacterium]|nr:ribosome maturation factor RimM [Candidatus Acidoferrales bacterium]
MSDSPADRVTLARILRPHGRRGEVAAEILTDFPERLTRLKSALLWDGRNSPRDAAISGCWLSKSRGGQAIFHFKESGSISDAEKLVGLQVQVPMAERVVLPAGSYYVTDLIGCEVFETRDAAAKLGVVRDVQFTGENVSGTPILVVDARAGELLIPLAVEICRSVDVAVRRIEVVLPEGLLDLNPSKSNR